MYRHVASAIILLIFLSACAQPQKYNWGTYSSSLRDYYEDPESLPQYVEALQKIIADSNKSGKKVPPGIYAECGYTELKMGHADKAIALFEQEKQSWPESRFFMDKEIEAAHRVTDKSTTATPSPSSAPNS